jgi:hypothetical protein
VPLCLKVFTITGWELSNYELNTPEILNGPNLQCDQTAINKCIANLATISCPNITSSEMKAVTDNCMKAVVGTLPQNGKCLGNIECQPTMYCNKGADGGLTDAGKQLGICQPFLPLNAQCGQPPYGPPQYVSDQCAYKGWQSPPRFCNQDALDASAWFCDNLRADNDFCYTDNECQSSLCSDVTDAGDCNNFTCRCSQVKSLQPICDAYSIKDAGGPG